MVPPRDDSNTQSASPIIGRPQILGLRPELADTWLAAAAQFPVRITRSFWSRVNPSDAHDPLAKQVLPAPDELAHDPDGLTDPVGDAACSPVPWVVHKYPSRALLLMTKRCHLYCRYCFRRTFEPTEKADPLPEEWEAAMQYLEQAKVTEVILSGGDPLAVNDRRLFQTLDRLQARIPVVRIHTRAPITYPDRVTPALVEGLGARRPIWVVVHANHPRELTPSVDQALGALTGAGIPVLNQAVLLRDVNDDVDTLAELCEALVERSVFPYYLHHTDAAEGNAHFRVPIEQGLALYDALRKRVSGVALPRYVIDPPEGTGKVDVQQWVQERG